MKLPDYAFKGLEPLRPTDIIPKGTAMFTTEDLSDFIDRGNDLLLTGNRPTDLQSLRETRGSTQSRSERWGRGLKKAGANAGGIIAESGVVLFNLLKAAVTKSPGASPVLAAQDSDFSFFEEVINSQAQKDIDEWSEGVRQRNPHYLTQAQQDYTTTQKLFKKDSGFWSDAVLGGFGFLAGTVATEFLRIGALKGLGRLAKIAKGTKSIAPARKVITEAAKSTAKGSDVLKMLRNAPASQTNSAGSAVNTILSVATSTAGESALEARMFREHAVEELKEQFKQINFREPTESEIYELEQMANNSGNAVFALNMATVGMSNAIMLGKMLGKGIKVGKFGKFGGDGIDVLNQAGKRIDRLKGRFALGRVAIEDGKAVVKLTKFQKALRALGKGAIKPLSEGAEEGLQYAYETGAVDYLLSKTNLDALDNVSLLSSITNEGLAETLGTQEGREQVLVGAILGFLGIPGAAPGSVVDMFRAGAGTDAFSKRLASLAADYNKWSETGLHANMASAVQQHEFNKRKMNAQDLMTMHDNKAAQTFSFFASRNALGLLDSEVDKIAEQIMAMDNETFAETYDKDIVLDNVEDVKKQLVTSLKDSATSFKEAHKIAKRINNNNYETQQDKDFVDGLAFVAYNIKDLDTREGQIVDRIKQIFPAFNQSAAKYASDLINENRGQQLEQRQQLNDKANNIINQSTELKEQIDTLKSQAQSLPDEEKAQVTNQLNDLVKRTQELDKQVEEAKAQIKQIDEAIAQSQATATASREARRQDTKLPDYNNEYDSFAETITQSLQNYIDTQNAIEAKTNTNVEADELFQELVDLGRIAKKREALIAQYNYFTQSTGKENMLELKEKMLEALHERQKYDFVKHYLLDKMAKENGLYDKADFDTALREAMALLKEMEDIGYETINEVQEHKIFALEDNNQVVYYSYVKYKDGTSRFYQVDERAVVVKGGRVIEDIDTKLQKFIEENEDTTQIDTIRRVYNDSWVNGVSEKLNNGIQVTQEEIGSALGILNFLNIPGVQVEMIDNTVVFEINDETSEYELVEANYDVINKTITQLFDNYFNVQVAQDNINKHLPQFLNSQDDTAKFSDSVIQENIENTGFYNNSERMAAAKQHFENNKAILLQYLISNYTSKRITPELMPAVIDNARRSIDNFNVPDYFNEQEAYQTDYFIALGQQLRGSEEFAEKTDEELITENPEVLDKDSQPGTTPTNTETKPQGQTLEEILNVKNPNNQADTSNNKPPSSQTDGSQDVPQNTESVKSYALRNILEVFTRSYTQEANKKATETVSKVLRTKASKKDAYKPVFRVVVGDVKNGMLDLGDHYYKDKDGTKKSDLKQQKGFVAKGRTVFLHLELQDPDTNEFVRIGQMLDPNRFKDAQGNDLDLTNADNIRRIYPEIDAQDIIPVSNGAVKMLNFTQGLTNYLNDEVANLETGTPIPEDVFEAAASQAGVVMSADQLREFVFPNDKSKDRLRDTARKAPEQFSILRNYPPDKYGISVTDDFGDMFDVIPYFRNGRLSSVFRVKDGVLETATVTEESKNKIRQAYKGRESRNNESNNHILILNSRLKLQTVDIVVPGKDISELEDFNQKYTNILVDNGDFGASVEDLGLFTLSMNSTLRQKKDNQTIRLQTTDGIIEFVAAPDSDVASLNVKRNRNKATNRNFVEFSIERNIKSSGNLINFTPVKYKFNYIGNKIEMSVNRNGKTVILNRYDTFNVEQVLKDINTDVQNNADFIKENLNTVENVKISNIGGGQTVYDSASITNADDIALTDVKSMSLRDATTKPKDYIVAMLRTDVAAEAVVNENGNTVRLMPNNVYAEFGLTEPVDTNLANTGEKGVDITEEDTSQEYDPDNKEDVTEEDIETVSSIEKRRQEELNNKQKFVSSKKRQEREGGQYKEISVEDIDLEAQNLEGIPSDAKVIVLEERGLDSNRQKVGTVRIVTKDGADTFEVVFNTDKINAKYDAEYVDAVKKGEMTKEQAMKALENVGRKESAAYTELAAVEKTPSLDRRSGESVKDFINRLFENNYLVEVDGKQLFSLTGYRWGIVVNIDGVKVPFYQSTSGTDTKITGQWYPFFGDLGNWLIKGNSDDSNVGYGFKSIQDVQAFLNKNIKETDAIALSDLISTIVRQNISDLRRLNESQIKGNNNLSINREATAKRLSQLMGYTVEEGRKTKTDKELFNLASKKVFAELASLEKTPSIEEANKQTTTATEIDDLDAFLLNDKTGATLVPNSIQSIGNETQVQQSLGVDIDTLLKNGTVKYTDETGTECAKAGMASAKFTAGSKWSLVKDLKNMPTHEQGGVNLTFGDGGFMVGTVKAEKGLVIKTDPPSDDTADLQTMKDAFEYTKKYYNSPKFKERYLNAYRKSYGNYNDIRGTDKEQDYLEDIKIEDIQFDNHFRRIQADINNNLKTGQYYLLQGNVEQPMSDRIKRIIKGRPVPSKEGIGSHLSKKRNIVFAYKDQVDHDGEKFGMKQIAPHEFSHQAVNYIESIPPNQAKEIEAMQKGRGGMHIDKVYETKADIDAVRYNMYKSGVYNPMEEDFTIEHLNKYKQTGDKTIKRLEKQYKTRDIIKLMNTVAFNDEDNYLPSYDPFGNTIKAQDGLVITDPPKTTQDSINFMADKIIQYEIARGSAQGTGLPKYKNPYYKDLLVNKIYPEVKKIMPNASAQEAAEAMDFIFNSGFDQTTFKIDKDPRGYALQEYYRKYDKSKLDSDGNWAGRKNPAYSFDDEYNNTIAKLPENERRILMNKGRDWYLQNIERGKGRINENLEAYKNTWYGRIWNTNDFRPFNANDPRFIYKKK